jgi:hypothetical protein
MDYAMGEFSVLSWTIPMLVAYASFTHSFRLLVAIHYNLPITQQELPATSGLPISRSSGAPHRERL